MGIKNKRPGPEPIRRARIEIGEDALNREWIKWHQFGPMDAKTGNRAGVRFGQYIWNNYASPAAKSWPELFYERSPQKAAGMIRSEIRGF